MDRESLLTAIQEVVREVLDNPSIVLAEDTEALDVDGWDSIHHVRILLGVEARLGIRFDMDEIQDLENVGALVSLAERRLASR